jgi:hypothetical protein
MYALISCALAFLAAGTLTNLSMVLIRGSSAPLFASGPTTLSDGHQVHDYVLRSTI